MIEEDFKREYMIISKVIQSMSVDTFKKTYKVENFDISELGIDRGVRFDSIALSYNKSRDTYRVLYYSSVNSVTSHPRKDEAVAFVHFQNICQTVRENLINEISEAIYVLESESYEKKVAQIRLNYNSYQIIRSIPDFEMGVDNHNRLIMGVPYILDMQQKASVKVRG